jgi:lipid-binding SYLF domain-containing protein
MCGLYQLKKHQMNVSRLTRSRRYIILMVFGAAVPAVAADETTARLNRAATVLSSITEPSRGVKPGYLAAVDCIVAIPGFKKGAAVVGVGYGRGYMSCRNAHGWSAPAAMALESGSVGVQIGGESLDIVILSLDKAHRGKLLGERFAIGSDASAAWGNGKSAHEGSEH